MKILPAILLFGISQAAFAQTTVTMTENSFQPAKITVSPGTKVTWTNKSTLQHTSTSGTGCKQDGKWNSGNVDAGKSFSHTFSSEGTFNYFCTPHCSAGMTGVVEVKGAAKKTGSATSEEKKNEAVAASEPKNQVNTPADNTNAAMQHHHDSAVKKKSTPQQATDQSVVITMSDNYFEPESITIPPGTKITWINKSNSTHTSTSGSNCAGDGKWNSGNMDNGASFSHTFEGEGSFNYYCIPHCSMGMIGVVNVKTGAPMPSTTAVAGQPRRRKKGPTPGFKSLDIINSPSTNTLNRGILDVSIYHRFDNISGTNGGSQVLYGLDNMRDMRIGLAYGLFKRITIGVGRSKGDWFNAPWQEVKNLYDGSIRINALRQDTCNIPVSVTVYANTVYCAMKEQHMSTGEAGFNCFSDRFSHSAQLMVSRDFGKHLSMQVMGTYVRRNWVNICAGSDDDLDIWAVGAGGRWALTTKLALIAEYYYVFSPYQRINEDIFFSPLAVGLEINTGGHVFHLNFGNSTGVIPNTYLPYTTSSWWDNGIRFGFSITRTFNMYNIKRR